QRAVASEPVALGRAVTRLADSSSRPSATRSRVDSGDREPVGPAAGPAPESRTELATSQWAMGSAAGPAATARAVRAPAPSAPTGSAVPESAATEPVRARTPRLPERLL